MKTTTKNRKRSFRFDIVFKKIVNRFLKFHNEWVVFKNDRFLLKTKRLKNETKNDRLKIVLKNNEQP